MDLSGSNAFRDWIFAVLKDVRRAIDYLETRADIDKSRIAYYGLNTGANRGPLVGALEPRLKTMILLGGGLSAEVLPPEIDAICAGWRSVWSLESC